MSDTQERGPVAVTGGTGYIGGRLVPLLLAAGFRVRALGRNRRKLENRPWSDHPQVELVEVDASDEEALARALEGCGAAYYLIHSMVVAGAEYAEADCRLARTFAVAAERARIERIVYLGGLGEVGDDLSAHLRSRREVERLLHAGSVPVTAFRAAMIIGSASASFEILRYLVERLPVMLTPRWVRTESQPIAVRNVLHYLVTCLDEPRTVDRTFDIGGPEIVSYADLIQTMARVRGLPPRRLIPIPLLTPRLSSLWLHVVTPVDRRLARPLTEGLRNRVVCRDDEAHRLMPQRLLSVEQAIVAALGKQAAADVQSSWSDAGVIPGDPDWAGGRVMVDPRSIEVDAPPAAVFRAICRVGGGHGWYAGDWLWRLRGWMDKLVGGPGLRRGRRNPTHVGYGDALDFWRVTAIEPDRRLELTAEMKLPGAASLTFDIDESPSGGCTLRQTARFRPRGLVGLAYWYSVVPLHGFVFEGMLRNIRDAAEQDSSSRKGPSPAPGPGTRHSARA
ncbi:SDR family oxidoreductase [Engelhardtia mirabilis]|uniref:SDR family oxidoreductase n=1 Tax=Engelhardtia mirabilis TaxID=2528011 RepID=UPI0011A0D33B